MLELIARVQVRIVRRAGLPHLPNDLQPPLAQSAQRAGVTFSFGPQGGVIRPGPRTEVAAQVGP